MRLHIFAFNRTGFSPRIRQKNSVKKFRVTATECPKIEKFVKNQQQDSSSSTSVVLLLLALYHNKPIKGVLINSGRLIFGLIIF